MSTSRTKDVHLTLSTPCLLPSRPPPCGFYCRVPGGRCKSIHLRAGAGHSGGGLCSFMIRFYPLGIFMIGSQNDQPSSSGFPFFATAVDHRKTTTKDREDVDHLTTLDSPPVVPSTAIPPPEDANKLRPGAQLLSQDDSTARPDVTRDTAAASAAEDGRAVLPPEVEKARTRPRPRGFLQRRENDTPASLFVATFSALETASDFAQRMWEVYGSGEVAAVEEEGAEVGLDFIHQAEGRGENQENSTSEMKKKFLSGNDHDGIKSQSLLEKDRAGDVTALHDQQEKRDLVPPDSGTAGGTEDQVKKKPVEDGGAGEEEKGKQGQGPEVLVPQGQQERQTSEDNGRPSVVEQGSLLEERQKGPAAHAIRGLLHVLAQNAASGAKGGASKVAAAARPVAKTAFGATHQDPTTDDVLTLSKKIADDPDFVKAMWDVAAIHKENAGTWDPTELDPATKDFQQIIEKIVEREVGEALAKLKEKEIPDTRLEQWQGKHREEIIGGAEKKEAEHYVLSNRGSGHVYFHVWVPLSRDGMLLTLHGPSKDGKPPTTSHPDASEVYPVTQAEWADIAEEWKKIFAGFGFFHGSLLHQGIFGGPARVAARAAEVHEDHPNTESSMLEKQDKLTAAAPKNQAEVQQLQPHQEKSSDVGRNKAGHAAAQTPQLEEAVESDHDANPVRLHPSDEEEDQDHV
ncbi:unnamed protein product [Amoebophrya sp. A120]|nr:unnamed protein product [Amoebophrya sp. A120]|eukprot:GSA120T00009794001.1